MKILDFQFAFSNMYIYTKKALFWFATLFDGKKNHILEPVFLMPVQCLMGIRSNSFIHIKMVLYF